MANGSQQLYDGFTSLEAGMDSGVPPETIGRNQVAMAVNCSFRGSFIGPRPAFRKCALTWPDDQGATQQLFENGKFQSAGCKGSIQGCFAPPDADPMIPVAIDGHVFLIDVLNGFMVRDLTIAGDANPINRDQGWFCQAEQYLLYQDGQSGPFIFDGANSRRADDAAQELPVGTCMGYGLGRLAVALSKYAGDGATGRQYVIGDILGGGTEVIQFTENTFLNEGGAFSTLYQTGDITGFGFPVNLNSQLGQGPLIVFTPKGVFQNLLPFDRTAWKDMTNPIQTVALMGTGSRSASIPNVNNDLWFRSPEGLRSLGLAIRNYGDPGDLPQSLEMARVLDLDTKNLLKFGSSAFFDNRMISTCSPVKGPRGCYHPGLVALDFYLQGGLVKKLNPCWEGLWTGLQTFAIIEGEFEDESRCFMVTLSQPDPVTQKQKIELWELLLDGEATADNNGTADVPILWSFEGPRYGFNAPKQYKQLAGGDFWFGEMEGPVTVAVQYRHDEAPDWQTWQTFSECATMTNCTPVNGCLPQTPAAAQFRYFRELVQPSDACDAVAKYPHRNGWLFQPRVTISGYTLIKSFRLIADPQPNPIRRPCLATEPCATALACDPALFAYQL